MNFDEAIENVKDLLESIGTSINKADYDGIIVKKLESSNTLDANRTTNQTHIAITGNQMDIFPYLRSDGYFERDSADMKKYFIMQVPVILSESNIKYINQDVPYDMKFENEKIKTYVSIIRSKRTGQAEQIQVSLTKFDDEKFIDFRKMLHVGSYLIILKRYERFEYECYGVLANSVNDKIQMLNNQFYGIRTNTIVYADELIYKEPKQNEYSSPELFNEKGQNFLGEDKNVIELNDYTEDELAEILKDFYDDPKYKKNAGIQLFGIKYGQLIKLKKYNITAILRKSGLKASYDTELHKGISLGNYVKIIENDVEYKIIEHKKMPSCESYNTGYISEFSRNRIIFGAPGTGKSYRLNKDRKELLKGGNEENYERVTFHPDYSYANFVGTYKPVPYEKEDKEGITYEYVPGPFMRIYVEAIKNSRTNNIKPYLLIIEEINRANVAAVFGDIFQLLDRDDNNVSEYPIEASEDIKKYLAKELNGNPRDYKKIYIPDNMFIWATMNSADQGVLPMDTAFKRRWEFDYLGIDEKEDEISNRYIILGEGEYRRKVEWNKLRKLINHKLSSLKVNEDKLLGPYFLSTKVIKENEKGEISKDLFIPVFKGKVLMYLFEDAAKQRRKSLFETNDDNIKYSSICKDFDEKGVYIFDKDISKEFDNDRVEEDNQ